MFFGTFLGDFGSGFGNFSGNFAQKRVLKRNFEPQKSHQNTPPKIRYAHKCGKFSFLRTHAMHPYRRLPRCDSPTVSIQNPLSSNPPTAHRSQLVAHRSSLITHPPSPQTNNPPPHRKWIFQSIILYIIYCVPSLCFSPAAS